MFKAFSVRFSTVIAVFLFATSTSHAQDVPDAGLGSVR